MNVSLRRYDRATDLLFLHNICSEEPSLFEIVSENIDNFEEQFNWKLFLNYQEFFIITMDDGEPCGCIFAYNYYPNDGHIMLAQYIDVKKRRNKIGSASLTEFLSILFSYYSIKRIFAVFNGKFLFICRYLECHGFHKTCTLSEYFFIGNKYYPQYIYSLERTNF